MSRTIETVLTLRDEVSKKLKGPQKAIENYGKSFQRVGKKGERLGRDLKYLGGDMLAMTAPFMALGGASLKLSADFDRTISKIQAFSSFAPTEIKNLEKLAMKIGESTSKSAKDAADGMLLLTQAGYSYNQVKEASLPLTNLAIAGEMDMARASELFAGAMRSANIPFEDHQKLLDQASVGSNMFKASVEDMLVAWASAGGELRSANMSMAETNALFGILLNSGKQASEAGTIVSRVFQNLGATGGEAKKAMKQLNISIANGDGTLRNKIEVLKELKSKIENMSEAEQKQYLQMIGGKQYAGDLKTMLDELGDTYDNNVKKINNSNGALQNMVGILKEDLKGQVEELSSKIEGAMLKIGKAITPVAEDVIKFANDVFDVIKKVDPKVIETVARIVLVVATMGAMNLVIGTVITTIFRFIKNLGNIIRAFSGIIQVVGLVGKGFGFLFKGVGKLLLTFLKFIPTILNFAKILGTGLLGVVKGAGTALLALGPIGWILIAVFIAIVGATILIVKNWDKVKVKAKEVADKIKELWQAFSSLSGVQALIAIFTEGFAQMLSGLKTIFDGVKTLFNGLVQLVVGIITGNMSMAMQGLGNVFKGGATIISGIWSVLKGILSIPLKAIVKLISTAFTKGVNAAKKLWGTLKKALGKAIKGKVEAVTSAFTKGMNKVKDKWQEVKNFLAHPVKGIVNLFQSSSSDGSHRSGRSKIPFDNYRAILHKDEMVLNKSDAEKYRNTSAKSNVKQGSRVVQIESLAKTLVIREEQDIDKLAKQLARELSFA